MYSALYIHHNKYHTDFGVLSEEEAVYWVHFGRLSK